MHTLAPKPRDRSPRLIVLSRKSPLKIANYLGVRTELRDDFLSIYINAPKAIYY